MDATLRSGNIANNVSADLHVHSTHNTGAEVPKPYLWMSCLAKRRPSWHCLGTRAWGMRQHVPA